MIQDILVVSRKNNESCGITGLLLCRTGHFVQLLEGDKTSVRRTFQKIESDRRHVETKILAEFDSESRIFPAWQMGFIEEKNQSALLSKTLNSILGSPILLADDMRSQVLQVLRSVTNTTDK